MLWSTYDEDMNILDTNNMATMPRILINLDSGIVPDSEADETIENSLNHAFAREDFVNFSAFESKKQEIPSSL